MRKLNTSVRRAFQMVAGVAVAAALSFTGTGAASAAPPPSTPRLAGENISPLANLEGCGGPIRVSLDSVPGRTDLLGVIFTPTGAFGASPECAAPVKVEWINGSAPFAHVTNVMVDKPGPTRIDVPVGAGVSLLTTQAQAGASIGTSQYVWMQP